MVATSPDAWFMAAPIQQSWFRIPHEFGKASDVFFLCRASCVSAVLATDRLLPQALLPSQESFPKKVPSET